MLQQWSASIQSRSSPSDAYLNPLFQQALVNGPFVHAVSRSTRSVFGEGTAAENANDASTIGQKGIRDEYMVLDERDLFREMQPSTWLLICCEIPLDDHRPDRTSFRPSAISLIAA